MSHHLKFILGLLLLFTIACNPNRPDTTPDGFEAITIQEGNHRSDPWGVRTPTYDRKYRWYFAQSARYYINPDSSRTGDQLDWNKLIGQSYTPFRIWPDANHINSAMVGWRYNPETDLMELNAYWHLDEQRDFTNTLVEVEIGQEFETIVARRPGNQVDVCIEKFISPDAANQTSGSVCHTIDFTGQNIPQEIREILTYFGGNRTAPNWILIYRKQLN